MLTIRKRSLLVWFLLSIFSAAFTQPLVDGTQWYLANPLRDSVQGMSVEEAYSYLKSRPSRTVLVAVIDSGIDIDHEDLKGVVWTNPREIAGNRIDDDANGYVDDIHGWSFLGSEKGNLQYDTYEVTRQLVRYQPLEVLEKSARSRKDKAVLEHVRGLNELYEKKYNENYFQYTAYRKFYGNLLFAVDTLSSMLGPYPWTAEGVDSLKSSDPVILFAKSLIREQLSDGGKSIPELIAELKEGYEYFRVAVEYGLNKNYDNRALVGDDYNDKRQRNYGCPDVKGPDPDHGTHVAGIIGADRSNRIGIKGIADNVRIMPIRAVPDGDERDKDVANAIYYAVNNGASIINMSFGKALSPDKEIVDEAVQYGEERGVLFIHAAGNDGADNDAEGNFPTPRYSTGGSARNWLEVAASSPGKDQNLVADFTNYGKNTVDVFAPGVDILSTVPGNGYKANSGTSMAAPAVTGVAALLMSRFPNLTAFQIKDILVRSVRKFDGLTVAQPSSGAEVELSDLCRAGGVVNALEAVKLAQQMSLSPGGKR